MPEDATVDQFVVREDSSEKPTETKTIGLGGDEVVIEAELAEESFMETIQSGDDEEYILRRILGKFLTPDFPTETVEGEELLVADMLADIATARVDRLVEEYVVMNGADRDAIQKAKEKEKQKQQEELLEGNSNQMMQVDAETAAQEARQNSE